MAKHDYREVDLCCGSIANKAKLIEEFELMERIIEGQQLKIEKLQRELLLLKRRQKV